MSLSHLISIRDLTREEAILLLDTAEQMAATPVFLPLRRSS